MSTFFDHCTGYYLPPVRDQHPEEKPLRPLTEEGFEVMVEVHSGKFVKTNLSKKKED